MTSLGATGKIELRVILLWLLTGLFAGRVVGQMVQFWLPQSFLPEFGSFQGSNLPYSVLLPSQILILGFMAWILGKVQARELRPSARTAAVLAWLGGIYMFGSMVRIVVGLTLPGASSWFTAWVPAAFHVVLAAFVLTLARCFSPGESP